MTALFQMLSTIALTLAICFGVASPAVSQVIFNQENAAKIDVQKARKVANQTKFAPAWNTMRNICEPSIKKGKRPISTLKKAGYLQIATQKKDNLEFWFHPNYSPGVLLFETKDAIGCGSLTGARLNSKRKFQKSISPALSEEIVYDRKTFDGYFPNGIFKLVQQPNIAYGFSDTSSRSLVSILYLK